MEFSVWTGALQLGYDLCSWNINSFFDCVARGDHNVQPAPPRPGYDTVDPTAEELVDSGMFQHDSETVTPLSSEPVWERKGERRKGARGCK